MPGGPPLPLARAPFSEPLVSRGGTLLVRIHAKRDPDAQTVPQKWSSIVTECSARLAVRLEPAQAYAATVAQLSGSASLPGAPVDLPDGHRLAVPEARR